MNIQVISVLGPDRSPDKMSPEEKEELASTFYVRPRGFWAVATAFGRGLVARPQGLIAGLVLAIRSSRWSLVVLARHLRFVGEALITGFRMQSLGISHLHTHFASTPALFAQAIFPIRLSATIHGPDEFTDPYGFLIQEKVRAADLVVAISNYGRSQLMRFSDPVDWPKLAVARLGVDSCEFAPAPRQAKESGPFEVICVGRLAPAKAQQVLLQACALLRDKGRTVLLRLVGHGPDRDSLEKAAERFGISQHVIFHGALSHDRVLELYRSADCFALASFAEGVPVVLMEAMALEIPCIATVITGIPELIENGREGILVSPSDPAALSGAIERLIVDPELRICLGKAGRAKILREYELARNIQCLSGAFSKFIHY